MLEALARLYPLFLLAGATIAAVLLLLRRQAREREQVALDLIRLNEALGFDTLRFLEAGAERLIAAGFRGVAWEIEWFGALRSGQAGSEPPPEGEAWERQAGAPDIAVRLRLLPGRLTGERRFFAEFLAETFMLLLKTDVWIKAGGIASTLSEFHRLTLFLGHDVKNLAQFIRLVGDQAQGLRPEDEAAFLAYLRTALPLFRERSERIIKALAARPPADGRPEDLDLGPVLESLCAAHGLKARIGGQGKARVPGEALDGILDNLLGNHARHAPGAPLDIAIRPAGGQVDIDIASGPAAGIDLLRLFEPFRTGSDQGLGLGLHQARQLARESGGSLGAAVGEGGRLMFHLRLPAAPDDNAVKPLDSPEASPHGYIPST